MKKQPENFEDYRKQIKEISDSVLCGEMTERMGNTITKIIMRSLRAGLVEFQRAKADGELPNTEFLKLREEQKAH